MCGYFSLTTEDTSMVHFRPGSWPLPRLFAALVALPLAFTAPPAQARQILYIVDSLNGIGEFNAVTGAAVNASLIPTGGAHSVVLDRNNHLFVAQSNVVSEYDATTGASINPNFISGPNLNTQGLLLDSNNHMFVSDFTHNAVHEYDATTGAAINYNFINGQGLNGPTGMAMDGNNHFFVRNTSGGSVGVYDATTGATINASLVSPLGQSYGLAVDSLNHLLVGASSEVNEYDATTGAAINTPFVPNIGASTITGLALDGNNDLYVLSVGGKVGQYDATTGATLNANLITGLTNPQGFTYFAPVPEPSSLLLVAGAAGIGVAVRRRNWLAAECAK